MLGCIGLIVGLWFGYKLAYQPCNSRMHISNCNRINFNLREYGRYKTNRSSEEHTKRGGEKVRNIDKALEIIKQYEGLRLEAYRCPSGIWTIGYGHTLNVKEGDTCTLFEAENYLYEDVKSIIKQMDNSIAKKGLVFTDCEYNALLSFTYNCGIGNFNKLVKDRTNTEIGQAILLYNKSNGIALRGLTKRRQTEHELYFSESRKKSNNLRVGYRVKDNYRIRIAPSLTASVIAYTDSSKKMYYDIKQMDGDFVLTEKGYIHKDAFYDKIEVIE